MEYFKKNIFNHNNILIIILLITTLISGGIIYLHYNIFTKTIIIKKEILFTIKPGTTVKNILIDLDNKNIISNSQIAEFYYKIKYNKRNINAGDYIFSGAISAKDVINKLVSGEVVSNEIKIVIPEGYNVFQIAKLLRENNLIKIQQAFIDSALPLEGYLFPDTYQFKKGSSINVIIKKMADNFNQKTKNIIQNKKDQKQIVILASLLEKEVISYHDCQIVAGIINKRLNANMPLQIDATVLYAQILDLYKMRQPMENIKRDHNSVKLNDLTLDSPYNTYLYTGLPPRPICNPGIKTINAVVNALKTDYWYYLNTKDGTTVFSKTYDEHLANKKKYLK